MIAKWRLANFKSVQNTTELPLAPLTIFAGPNSSGKSTMIQSMLLISQTLRDSESDAAILLNGPLARLGVFDDVHSAGSDAPGIHIGWECEPRYRTNAPFSDFSGFYDVRAISAVTCHLRLMY